MCSPLGGERGDESVIERLVARYVESGHPFPREAVAFATGGSDETAQRLLDELDAPSPAGTWEVFRG